MSAKLNVYLFCALLLASCSDNKNQAPRVPIPHINNISKNTNFKKDADVAQKKQRHFDFLMPFILYENTKIYNARQLVLFAEKNINAKTTITKRQKKNLKQLALKYDIEEELYSKEFWLLLRRRMDVLPPSLVVSQTALESA